MDTWAHQSTQSIIWQFSALQRASRLTFRLSSNHLLNNRAEFYGGWPTWGKKWQFQKKSRKNINAYKHEGTVVGVQRVSVGSGIVRSCSMGHCVWWLAEWECFCTGGLHFISLSHWERHITQHQTPSRNTKFLNTLCSKLLSLLSQKICNLETLFLLLK